MGFEMWEGVHDSPDQKKRIASAQTAACTPVSISREEGRGTFSGSHGVYQTTLESCTCADFSRRRLPCKHVYRLAIELGVMEGAAASDVSKVKRPAAPGRSLKQAVADVEKLGVDDQRLLRSVLSEAVYKKAAYHKKKRGEDFGGLIAAGFVVQIDEPAGVILSEDLANVRRKLCTYLSRRNEVDHYYDENGDEHEIPKGAEFTATITIGVGSELSLAFPDDEITELLDLYGVNRCRRWKP